MEKKILFPNEEIYDSENFNIHQDREVPIHAFFIIESKRKIRSFSEFTDEESMEFMQILKKLRIGMETILSIKDVYFFQNEDSEHGFHLWVFPRHTWMEKFGRKIQSVRPIINYAKENLTDEKTIAECKVAVEKMKEFMENPGKI